MSKRLYRTHNWNDYNKGLVKRGDYGGVIFPGGEMIALQHLNWSLFSIY